MVGFFGEPAGVKLNGVGARLCSSSSKLERLDEGLVVVGDSVTVGWVLVGNR